MQASGLSPAVFHKVMHNFVQDLLEQGGADTQVLDGKRGQVGQLWQLPRIFLEALDLVSPLRPIGKKRSTKEIHRTSMQTGKCSFSLENEGMAVKQEPIVLQTSGSSVEK